MKFFLTGVTGLLGNNVMRLLLQNGHEVAVLSRRASDPRPLDGLDVEKIYGDLGSAEIFENQTFGQVIGEVDVVIHMAALIQLGWSKRAMSMKVNAEATKKIAATARRHQVRLVHVSTVDVLGLAESVDRPCHELDLHPANPDCSYVASKRAGDEQVAEEINLGLDAVIVHPGFMLGPYDWKPSSGKMLLALKNHFIHFAPAGSCSTVDVRDVADGIFLAATKGRSGENYILGGHNLSYFDLWTRICLLLETKPPKRKLPDWIARAAGATGDLLAKLKSTEPTVNSAATLMGQKHHCYDSSKAVNELGYSYGGDKPEASLENAIRDAWSWLESNGYT